MPQWIADYTSKYSFNYETAKMKIDEGDGIRSSYFLTICHNDGADPKQTKCY